MSQIASFRMPYADAEAPHQMVDDCRAVGTHLQIPARPELPRHRGQHVHPPTTWFVSEEAAALASGLHLHLD